MSQRLKRLAMTRSEMVKLLLDGVWRFNPDSHEHLSDRTGRMISPRTILHRKYRTPWR